MAALLFAVHPIHTEAVTYVSGRSDPLAALLMLAAALWFLRGRRRLVLSVVAFLLALLAREAAMVLPLLLVVVDVGVTTARRCRWSVYLPYAGVLALYLLLRTTVIGGGAREALAAAVPLRLRLLTMAKVVVEYLGLLIVPLHLHMERVVRPAASPLEPSILASVAVIAGLLAAILLHRKTWPLGFCLAWFFVALLPVANIVPLGTFMAEHWLYVPSMGCFLAAGWGVARLADRLPRRAVMAMAAIVLASYAGATIRRNADWRDGPTLYQTMLPLAPESPRLYGNLGQTYQEAGDNEKAKTAYEHVLELTNNDLERAMALNNLGKLYRDEKRYR
ncbi:MAG: tetratricopeptide repeat protein, partial [Deltaproteobacteria bacterium]